jgi:hypothetical protein
LMAKSPRDTTPTGRPPSSTGSRRKALSVMSCTASSIEPLVSDQPDREGCRRRASPSPLLSRWCEQADRSGRPA